MLYVHITWTESDVYLFQISVTWISNKKLERITVFQAIIKKKNILHIPIPEWTVKNDIKVYEVPGYHCHCNVLWQLDSGNDDGVKLTYKLLGL